MIDMPIHWGWLFWLIGIAVVVISTICRNRMPRIVRWGVNAICVTFLVRFLLLWTTPWNLSLGPFADWASWLTIDAYLILVLPLVEVCLRPRARWKEVACLVVVVAMLMPVPAVAFIAWFLSGGSYRLNRGSIRDRIQYETWTWDAGAMGSSGVDIWIYRTPRYLPFLQRTIHSIRFDDMKCNSKAARLILQPDRRHVIARCPYFDYQHMQGYHDFLIPLN